MDPPTAAPEDPSLPIPGSIGKLFTATAVLRLVQDGRLGLADPVGRCLEGFSPEVAGVTVEQLLRLRSGLGDYLSDPEFEADPDRFLEPADFLPLARKQAPAFEPGTAAFPSSSSSPAGRTA